MKTVLSSPSSGNELQLLLRDDELATLKRFFAPFKSRSELPSVAFSSVCSLRVELCEYIDRRKKGEEIRRDRISKCCGEAKIGVVSAGAVLHAVLEKCSPVGRIEFEDDELDCRSSKLEAWL